jgi:hypothetical protein
VTRREYWGISPWTDEETWVTEKKRESLSKLSDDEVISRFRELKSDVGGSDPALTPLADESDGDVRDEMERRGLAPDREDVIPDDVSPSSEPTVENHA